jgi:aspartate dehydrogenase
MRTVLRKEKRDMTKATTERTSGKSSRAGIALVGFGAMGEQLYNLLREHGAGDLITTVIEHPDRLGAARAKLPASVTVAPELNDMLAAATGLMVECAGHAALRKHAAPALAAGVDVLVASVGALADAQIESALREAAAASGSRVFIPSGALGGLDALASARYAGLEEVIYISNKAPSAWRGTKAEQMVDLDAVREPTVFLTCNAREAALQFPQNANVAAAVALAGIGFEKTQVRLTVDPNAKGNRHRIMAKGQFGMIDVTVEGRTLPSNPKTSMLAPMSLLKSILNRQQALVLA